MKHSLLALLFSTSMSTVWGQTRDTVPEIMLCIDTSDSKGAESHVLGYHHAFYIIGFGIKSDSAYSYRQYHNPNHDNGYGGTTLMAGYYTDEIGHIYTHVAYLDADKRKLDSSIIVWMTKYISK